MIRLGVLGSMRGTGLLAIDEAIKEKKLNAHVSLVLSNKRDAYILKRAEMLGYEAKFVDFNTKQKKFDQTLSKFFRDASVNLIVLIGYMKILSNDFVSEWHNKIINVHPSLLPLFSGQMDLRVHRAVLDSGAKETGCTVHFVTEAVDAGPIILQKRCPVFEEDTPEALKERVQALEKIALVEAIEMLQGSSQDYNHLNYLKNIKLD